MLQHDLTISRQTEPVSRSGTKVSNWFSWLHSIGARFISEVDCRDQFNNICPSTVANHLTSASAWLSKHRKWRMSEIEWSIHKDVKKLD